MLLAFPLQEWLRTSLFFTLYVHCLSCSLLQTSVKEPKWNYKILVPKWSTPLNNFLKLLPIFLNLVTQLSACSTNISTEKNRNKNYVYPFFPRCAGFQSLKNMPARSSCLGIREDPGWNIGREAVYFVRFFFSLFFSLRSSTKIKCSRDRPYSKSDHDRLPLVPFQFFLHQSEYSHYSD